MKFKEVGIAEISINYHKTNKKVIKLDGQIQCHNSNWMNAVEMCRFVIIRLVWVLGTKEAYKCNSIFRLSNFINAITYSGPGEGKVNYEMQICTKVSQYICVWILRI